MKEIPKDCMNCANSHITDEDELYCIINKKIVKDEDICEDYN